MLGYYNHKVMENIFNVQCDVLVQKRDWNLNFTHVYNARNLWFMQFMSCLAEFVNKNKRTQKSFSSCQSKMLSVDTEVLLSCY